MSAITEILDRIPNPDGGLRRRFTSGLIFLLVTTIGIFWFPGIPQLAETVLDARSAIDLQWSVLKSPSATVILFGIIFVVGNVIDVIGDVFLNRVFFLFGGTIAYRGVSAYFMSIVRHERSTISLTESERSSYEELPPFVQEGLRNPYKRQFAVAFRFLIYLAPENEKVWLQQLDSRNKNLFSVLCSMFISVLLVSSLSISIDRNTSMYNLSSSDVRDCYLNLAIELRSKELLSGELSSLAKDIQAREERAVSYIEQVLIESESFLVEILGDSPGDASEKASDLWAQFQNCHSIENSRLVVPQRTLETVLIGILAMFVFLLSLSVTYALMVRNAITSALEMLWLRRGISANEKFSDVERW